MSIKTLNEIKRSAEVQIDRLLNRVIRIFGIDFKKHRMQPEEVEEAVIKALDLGCVAFKGGYFIPNTFIIHLHPDNMDLFKGFWSIFVEVIHDTVTGHIRNQHNTAKNSGDGFSLDFAEDSDVSVGQVRCETQLISDRGK